MKRSTLTKEMQEAIQIGFALQEEIPGISLTAMAEEIALELDHDEWLDDETHWIWDIVVDIEEGTL